jgi:hypothetical protein
MMGEEIDDDELSCERWEIMYSELRCLFSLFSLFSFLFSFSLFLFFSISYFELMINQNNYRNEFNYITAQYERLVTTKEAESRRSTSELNWMKSERDRVIHEKQKLQQQFRNYEVRLCLQWW